MPLALQIGQHTQQLCHLLALAKCVNQDESTLAKGRGLLINMQRFCLHSMGIKELLQAPTLPPAASNNLDACCSVSPNLAPLRSVTAVPILWHIHPLLEAVASSPASAATAEGHRQEVGSSH